MIVCLDTNTMVQALARHHPFNPILEAWVQGCFTLAVSTPILLEYQEVLTRLGGAARWQKFSRLLDLAELTETNVLRVNPAFRFRVVVADLDDNIFTDCAITANADYLVTEDHHFSPLADSGYKPRLVSPAKFMESALPVVFRK